LLVIARRPILIEAAPSRAAWNAALAAIPAALAVSGKLTVGCFAAGLAAGFLFLEAPLPRRLWLLLWFGVGGTIVAAIAVGPWLLHLWSATGDPFYPFFARFFHSPFAGDAWTFDRWRPRSLGEAVIYPFVMARDGTRVAEVPFTDFRFALAYLLVPLALGARLCRPSEERPPLP